jgi:hypothetical protein
MEGRGSRTVEVGEEEMVSGFEVVEVGRGHTVCLSCLSACRLYILSWFILVYNCLLHLGGYRFHSGLRGGRRGRWDVFVQSHIAVDGDAVNTHLDGNARPSSHPFIVKTIKEICIEYSCDSLNLVLARPLALGSVHLGLDALHERRQVPFSRRCCRRLALALGRVLLARPLEDFAVGLDIGEP